MAILTSVRWYLIVFLIYISHLHFSNNWQCWAVRSVEVFCPFFSWVVCFVVELCKLFCIFQKLIKPLLVTSFANTFSHPVSFLLWVPLLCKSLYIWLGSICLLILLFLLPWEFDSVQFSRSVVSDSLQPHGLQDTRPPCPSPAPGACSNTRPLSQWCHPTISSSVISFSSCLQSFPASGSLPMSQFFASGGQSIGASASALVLPMNTQDWSPLVWTGWISLQSKGLSRVFSNTTVQKHQFSSAHFLYSPTLTSIHNYWKKHSFD